MKNQSLQQATVYAPDTGKSLANPPPKPIEPAPSVFRSYLEKKKLHLKYLIGKLSFLIRYPRMPRYFQEKKLHLKYLIGKLSFRIRYWRTPRYFQEKKLHLKYLTGKVSFRIRYWWAPRYFQEKKLHLKDLPVRYAFHLRYWSQALSRPSFYVQQLHDLSLKCHGMELGILRQYSPRPVQASALPVSRRNAARLPTIAIVTPSYNQSHLITHTIESVLGQDYPHLEYAVVDGGSTDGTKEVLERYRDRLDYHVSEPDDGQSHAIVKGFVHLEGEIMAYLNSDDLLMAGALQFVGEFFAAHPCIDVIYGHRVVIDEAGQEVGRWILPRHDAHAIRHFDYVPQETLFWRRSLYEAVGGICPSFQFAMDWDLLLRFITFGARFYRAPHFLACFRIHSKQKTHTLLDTVGENEKARLLAREHPNGYCWRRTEEIKNSYRMRSSLCAALLKCGIRY